MSRAPRAPARRSTTDEAPKEPRPTKQARQAEREIVVTLRLPRELHARLRDLGGERGLTAQIRERLDASLAMEEAWRDPLFAELLRAVGYVIVSAATLYPGDLDAYSIVELAIRMLLDTFRPEGARDIIHETFVPTTTQMLGKVERLLGVALGQLGEAGVARAAKRPILKIAPEEKI
jgi:hypothetical protein